MDAINEMVIEIIRNLESFKQIKDNRRMDYKIRHADYYCSIKENASDINLRYYKSFEKLLELLGEHFIETGLAKSYHLKQNIKYTLEGSILIYTEYNTIDVIVHLGKLTYGICDYSLLINGEYFNPVSIMVDKIISILFEEDTAAEDLYDFYVLANRFDFSGYTLYSKFFDYYLCYWPQIEIEQVNKLEELYNKWKQLKIDVLFGKTWLWIPDFNQVFSFFNTTVWFCRLDKYYYR